MEISALRKPAFPGTLWNRGNSITYAAVNNGMSADEIVAAYPYLEPEDVREALRYAAWLAEETVDVLEPTRA